MRSAGAAIERLCDPHAEVSAHYVIAKTGEITQLVPEHLRAWHAGAGEWQGLQDINSRSIGIELDNDGAAPFPDPLMAALETLMDGIMARHGITAQGVIGHSDMAPGRKIDPGPRFDWLRLERMGRARPRGQGQGPERVTPEQFRKAAHACGYPSEVDGETLLQAVRLRYRPWARGPLSPEDAQVLAPV